MHLYFVCVGSDLCLKRWDQKSHVTVFMHGHTG